MKVRVVSGLIMAPLLIIVYIGGWFLNVACLVIGIAAVREFFRGFDSLGIKPSWLVASAGLVGIYLGLIPPFKELASEIFMLTSVLVVFFSLLWLIKDAQVKLENSMATILGFFYVGVFSFHIPLVSSMESNSILVWLIFLSAFGTDIMAYFTGSLLGKHKLCPSISPKKTVEGSIGGILGSVILCGGFAYFICPSLLTHSLILGLLGGVISQLGDLTASVFKRKMGIKDYGNLIPGHGGILDRIDSLLFTAPMVYYYAINFIV